MQTCLWVAHHQELICVHEQQVLVRVALPVQALVQHGALAQVPPSPRRRIAVPVEPLRALQHISKGMKAMRLLLLAMCRSSM